MSTTAATENVLRSTLTDEHPDIVEARISIGYEDMYPEEAEELLKVNPENRRLSRSRAKNYSRMKRENEWDCYNGEPIKIDYNGELIDGQHRLQSVVYYDRPVRMLVIRGLPPSARKTIDQGKTRSASDILKMEGYPHTTALAASLLLLHFYKRGKLWKFSNQRERPSNMEILELAQQHPQMLDDVRWACSSDLEMTMTQSVGAFLRFVFRMHDEDLAEEFMEKVKTGMNFQSKSDPAYALRERLLKLRQEETTSLRRKAMLALAIRAWNKARKGEELEQVHMPRGEYPQPK